MAAHAPEVVCTVAELSASPGKRRCARLKSGRGVLVMLIGETLSCVDALCYHHGAPLIDGDVEDIGGHVVIRCPWHKYLIEPATGECLYHAIVDMATRETAVKSKGLKQRTHAVQVSSGNVVVTESTLPGDLPSDHYARDPFPPAGAQPPKGGAGGVAGGGVPLHSSVVRYAP